MFVHQVFCSVLFFALLVIKILFYFVVSLLHMKFGVVFVNEASMVKMTGGNAGIRPYQKNLRYEAPKNTDLPLHVLNIHKSLYTLGFSFEDTPQSFTLRVQPAGSPPLPSYPVYLKSSGPEIDAQLAQLSTALPKTHRKKGFNLEFVLSPAVLATRFIDNIKGNSKISATKVKETAFNLVTQLKVRLSVDYELE